MNLTQIASFDELSDCKGLPWCEHCFLLERQPGAALQAGAGEQRQREHRGAQQEGGVYEAY